MVAKPARRPEITKLIGLMAALGALASTPVLAQAIPSGNGSLAGMRFYDAEQLTPAAAKQNYFDGAGATVTYNWASQKPWEITATAAALENDPQKIFAFVKNHVRFEPRFGAQKGAVGAIIDRSGTAFDQAQLLVELLRAAGFTTASYQVGTLTLTGAEFTDWTGIVDATAARQVLANGGIPVEVVGSTSISSVTMGHAWVTVTIGGSPVVLDPSYKRMDRWAQIDVAAKSGLSPAGFVSLAASATVQNDGNPYVTGVNLAGAKTSLDTAATTLLTELRGATYKDKRSEEIAGGERIRLYDDPWANKTTGTLSASWGTYEGGLPDKYRTKVSVGARNCRAQHFADEIYGRRLIFRSTKQVEYGPPWAVQSIGVDRFAINEKPGADCSATPAIDGMSIAVDLPYAARAPGGAYGSWMDRTSLKEMDFGADAQVVLGWGDAGSELQARLSDDFRISVPSAIVDGSGISGPGAAEYYGPPVSGASVGPAVGDAKLYGAWLAQMTRAASLLEGVAASRIQHHYTIGVVYTQIQRQVEDNSPRNLVDDGNEPVVPGSQQDASTRINIDSGYSTTSLTGSGPDKLATRHLIAAMGSMLEGSMFEQQMDAVDTSSTAQRLPWGQENVASTIRYYRLLPGSTAPQEYRQGAISSLGATCKGLQTANLGYAVIQPNDRYLGPGTTLPWSAGSFNGISPKENRAPQSDHHMHRGCAWIAFNSDASEIAHIVTSIDRELKGAGGPSKKDTNDRAAPQQADLLKDAFKDRSNIEGVDLRTGAFTYKPAPDLVVGQGEFPYSLSFQRVFQAGGATCPKCVSGWTHNFDIRATISGGGLEGMGQTAPLALAAPLVAIKAGFEIYKADPNGLGNHLGALGVMRWLSERLTYNVVTVNQGASSETFVRVADKTFAAPPGSQSTLTQTGERFKFESNQRHGRSPIWLYGGSSNPQPMTFVRTSGAGDKIEFQWLEWNPTEIPNGQNDYGSLKGFAQGFFAKTWTFPQGASLAFTYCTEPPVTYGGEPTIPLVMSLSLPCADRLKRVENNLGVWIDIDRLNATSSDGRGTFVTSGLAPAANYTDVVTPIEQYPYVATGFVDVAGKWRAYEWEFPSFSGRPSSSVHLKRILAPVDYTGGIHANDDNGVTAQSGVAKLILPLANDTPLGLVIANVTQPTNGTVTRTATTVTYTSTAGYSGPDQFTYKVRDSSGASMWATVRMIVTLAAPANRPPQPSNKAYEFLLVGGAIPESAAYINPLWEDRNSDPDGDSIDFAPNGVPATDFSLQPTYKQLKYLNAAFTYGGPRVYSYTITDPHGATGTATISVTVPNRPPVVNNVTWEWDVSTGNAWVPVLQGASDPDGFPLTVVSTSTPNAIINTAGTEVRYSPVELDHTYSFNFTVSDGYHNVTKTVTLSVVDSGGCRVGMPCN